MADERLFWNQRGLVAAWWGFLAGPVSWALDEPIGYALVKPSCAAGTRAPLYGMSAVAVLIAVSGLYTAWRLHARIPAGAQLQGGRVIDRSYWMSVAGMVTSAFFLYLALTAIVPQVLLDPCA